MKPYHLLLAILLYSAGCTEQQTDNTASQADALFTELQATYLAYTDSLRLASDSASTARAVSGLDEALRKVYAKYPPDSDRMLTPAHNDSLWSLTEAYMKLREQRGLPLRQKPDSIANRPDSIAQPSDE